MTYASAAAVVCRMTGKPKRLLLAPLLLAAALAAGCRSTFHASAAHYQHGSDAIVSPKPYLVAGFVGGIVRHDDPVRSEYKLAEHLRADYPANVYVETFENRHREDAHKVLLRLLDTDGDGMLSDAEKRDARIVLYGHSWGGAAVVKLARELGSEGIPVLLTIQVDSVGQHDDLIPPNVARAANFYQPSGLIHGQSRIRAADASRTEILGNFRLGYKGKSPDCSEFPWYERVFVKTHTKIACDPHVWSQVEALIRSELPAPHNLSSQ